MKASPAAMQQRLAALRARIAGLGADAMLIRREDAFGGEEVRPCDERLAFISGFTGSAGAALITPHRAVLISDARYSLQMAEQTAKHDGWECETAMSTTAAIAKYLAAHAKDKDADTMRIIGFDPWCLTRRARNNLARALADNMGDAAPELRALPENPVDMVWEAEGSRPPVSATPAIPYPAKHAGRSRGEKIKSVLAEMGAADAMLITDPTALAWLLNIRGRDLASTPLMLAFAMPDKSGRVTLFTDEARFAGCDKTALAFAPDTAAAMQKHIAGAGCVMLDPATCPVALADMIAGEVVERASPITAMKAVKTDAEIAGIIAAHKTDGLAMIRFLHWFDTAMQSATPPTELDVAARLESLRADAPDFIAPSFATICGGGAHGAIVHYRADEDTNAPIPRDSLCLVDSGGQYHTATTDITRTIATGKATPAMRRDFTHVLRSHIALAQCRFAPGTTGAQLDGIARAPLWQAGMDFAHGTGHGVGCALSVHEGPVSIARGSNTPLQPGMLLSNEPGCYREGAYGIRIENLVVVRRDDTDGMLFFETVSLAPIDLRPVDAALLDEGERGWLNAYHRRVREALSPLLAKAGGDDSAAVAAWLASVTDEI